jgi:hypothetical protein
VLFERPGRTASSAPRSNGPGGSTSCSRSDISGRRDAALYPFAGGGAAASDAALLDRREPLIFLFSKFSIAPIDGARAVRATGSNRFGAFSRATVGWLDFATKSYKEIAVDERCEVPSAIDENRGRRDGKANLHVHIMLGLSDESTRGERLLQEHDGSRRSS